MMDCMSEKMNITQEMKAFLWGITYTCQELTTYEVLLAPN